MMFVHVYVSQCILMRKKKMKTFKKCGNNKITVVLYNAINRRSCTGGTNPKTTFS